MRRLVLDQGSKPAERRRGSLALEQIRLPNNGQGRQGGAARYSSGVDAGQNIRIAGRLGLGMANLPRQGGQQGSLANFWRP